jgi:hypothetical protein
MCQKAVERKEGGKGLNLAAVLTIPLALAGSCPGTVQLVNT